MSEIIKFKDKYGASRKGIMFECSHCKKDYIRRVDRINTTSKVYCSRKCAEKSRKLGRMVSLCCAYCDKSFEKDSHDMKKSKSGLRFCSKRCMDTAKRGESVLNFKSSLYNGGRGSYRRIAYSNYDHKCMDCNLSFKPLLTIHHVDGNRKNNSLDNLEVLCRNHHNMRHMKLKNGVWVRGKKDLTPRHLLKKVRESVENKLN